MAIVWERHCDLGPAKCKPCKNAYASAYYKANTEKCRAIGRKSMKVQRERDPQKFNDKDKARWRGDATRRMRMRRWAAKYAASHPEVKQAARLLRVARQKGAPGRYTTADVVAQFNAQSGMCFYCVRPMASFQIEHKTPICRGGTNWPDNIVCACALCNQRKGKRTAEEFFAIIRAEQVANDVRAA